MTMSFRTLDLNLLRVFDTVMAERHVTRAASRLSMTQPAVSNALRRLREAIGEELFIPGATGVTPTRKAQALWPVVRVALESLHAALESDVFDARRDEREFTIAMADATAAVLMPALIEDWLRAQTRSTARVVRLDSRDPRPMLERGEADCAVGFFPEVARELAGDDGRGTARLQPLYDCHYVSVMRRDHPLSASSVLSLDDYCASQHLRVNFAGRPHGYVDEALSRLGRTRRVVLTVDHFSTAGRVVSGSDLITVLPRSFVAATGVAHLLEWRPLSFELPRINVAMLWHRRHEHDSAQHWLRAALLRAASQVAQGLPCATPTRLASRAG
jgi:DNA-binding transcriptional LysR family regulator